MKKSNIFLLITFSINWLLALAIYLLDINIKSILGTILLVLYMFIPMAVAIFTTKFIHKEKPAQSLKMSFDINKWFLVAWLVMPIFAVLTFGISLLFPEVYFSPNMEGMFDRFQNLMTSEQIKEMRESIKELPIHPLWLSFIQGMIAGVSVNAVAAFGEETGWRGLLLREYSHMSFLKVSLFIGIIWGIWHAPIILMGHNYPQHPVIGVGMMTVWCILLSPLFTYIFIKSKSVIAASILHGTLNGTAGIAILPVAGGNDLIVGVTGISGFIALVIIIAIFIFFDKYISKEHIFFKPVKDSIEYKP